MLKTVRVGSFPTKEAKTINANDDVFMDFALAA